MLTEEQIDVIGLMLEDKGLTHSEIDSYLEHRGVKGMKWGVRRQQKNTARYQKITIDPQRRVASGKGSFKDKLTTFNDSSWKTILTAKSYNRNVKFAQALAQKNLSLYKQDAKKMNAGKTNAQIILGKISGVNISKLNVNRA